MHSTFWLILIYSAFCNCWSLTYVEQVVVEEKAVNFRVQVEFNRIVGGL